MTYYLHLLKINPLDSSHIQIIYLLSKSKIWIKFFSYSFEFLSFDQKLIQYTSTLSLLTDWLTYWLICPHNAPTNLTKEEKSYSSKVSGSKSPGQRSLEATTWEFIRKYLVDNNSNKLKAIKLVHFNKSLFPDLQLAPSGFN